MLDPGTRFEALNWLLSLKKTCKDIEALLDQAYTHHAPKHTCRVLGIEFIGMNPRYTTPSGFRKPHAVGNRDFSEEAQRSCSAPEQRCHSSHIWG